MKPVLLLILRGYKYLISPMLGQNCRFYPSCSEYAAQAIQEYGAVKGSMMAGKRLCKCHPWHEGGVDLVPPNVDNASLNADSNAKTSCQFENKLDDEVNQLSNKLENPTSVATSVTASSKPS